MSNIEDSDDPIYSADFTYQQNDLLPLPSCSTFLQPVPDYPMPAPKRQRQSLYEQGHSSTMVHTATSTTTGCSSLATEHATQLMEPAIQSAEDSTSTVSSDVPSTCVRLPVHSDSSRLPKPCPLPSKFSKKVEEAILHGQLIGTKRLQCLRECCLFYYEMCPKPSMAEYDTMANLACVELGVEIGFEFLLIFLNFLLK